MILPGPVDPACRAGPGMGLFSAHLKPIMSWKKVPTIFLFFCDMMESAVALPSLPIKSFLRQWLRKDNKSCDGSRFCQRDCPIQPAKDPPTDTQQDNRHHPEPLVFVRRLAESNPLG